MDAGGTAPVSIERRGRFARVRTPGQDHLFRIDKLAGGSVLASGIELRFQSPLDVLDVPCPDGDSAASLWERVCDLVEEDAAISRDERP